GLDSVPGPESSPPVAATKRVQLAGSPPLDVEPPVGSGGWHVPQSAAQLEQLSAPLQEPSPHADVGAVHGPQSAGHDEQVSCAPHTPLPHFLPCFDPYSDIASVSGEVASSEHAAIAKAPNPAASNAPRVAERGDVGIGFAIGASLATR